jgi:hypothetical protein
MGAKQSSRAAGARARKPGSGATSAQAAPKARVPARAKATARGAAVVTPAPAARVRLARVAKGRKPQYFSDPAIDKLLSITMTLAAELSVTRDRLDTVERLLAKRRVLGPEDVDQYEPDAAAEAQRETRRQAYLDRVLRAVQGELEELTRRDMPASNEEVIAAVSG